MLELAPLLACIQVSAAVEISGTVRYILEEDFS